MNIKKRIIYILKHNILIQKIYKLSMSLVFRILGLFIKIDPDLILFVSFMGTKYNDSPKAIFEYIQKSSKYSNKKCVWAFEDSSLYPGIESVKMDSFNYFKTALKAKYWVTNTNIERGLKFKKKKQVYLNTWHGIALKKIGNDCPGRNDYNFDTVNYLCVSGKYDEQVFKTAFKAKNDSYLRCGMPRNDILWHISSEETKIIKAKLGINSNKKVILYAPTWRDSQNGGVSYDLRPPIDFDNWKKKLGDEYLVLFRAHHITTKVMNVSFNDFVINVSDYPEVNDLMIAADILITDYSAIAFDFSILCKPILCFAYDYDTYLSERGTYFDMKNVYPNPICFDEDSLLDRIICLDYEKECCNTKIFRDKFFQYKANATECSVKALFS